MARRSSETDRNHALLVGQIKLTVVFELELFVLLLYWPHNFAVESCSTYREAVVFELKTKFNAHQIKDIRLGSRTRALWRVVTIGIESRFSRRTPS